MDVGAYFLVLRGRSKDTQYRYLSRQQSRRNCGREGRRRVVVTEVVEGCSHRGRNLGDPEAESGLACLSASSGRCEQLTLRIPLRGHGSGSLDAWPVAMSEEGGETEDDQIQSSYFWIIMSQNAGTPRNRIIRHSLFADVRRWAPLSFGVAQPCSYVH